MKTTSNSFIPLQVKQVTSLLHDRQQCATVAGIAQDLSLSRTAASELLQTIASLQQQVADLKVSEERLQQEREVNKELLQVLQLASLADNLGKEYQLLGGALAEDGSK